MQFHSRGVFQRSTLNEFNEIDVSRIVAYFHTPSIVVSPAFAIDLNAAVEHFKQRVDEFTKLGSGYILEYVDQLSVSFVKFRPMGQAGSYVPAPTWIKYNRAIINVRNYKDQKCFVWSILSCLYPVDQNTHRVQNYTRYEKTLNLDGLKFPLPVKDIPKFENQNDQIAIHCIAADKDCSFSILHLSPHAHERRYTITLLLLDHWTIRPSAEKDTTHT